MISANNSDIADPIMRMALDASLQLGCPVIAADNNPVEFVTTMPDGHTAPRRISGITYTTVPAILFSHEPVTRQDPTLKGGKMIMDGFADFIVVAPRGGFANQANIIAAEIARLFPVATRIAVNGGQVTIMQPPMPMAGYDDGVYWRVPVRVNYRAS